MWHLYFLYFIHFMILRLHSFQWLFKNNIRINLHYIFGLYYIHKREKKTQKVASDDANDQINKYSNACWRMCGCLLRLKKIIPGGSAYTGPFASSFQTAFVRIRAWRLCDFPPANFTSDGVYDISSKGAYFIQYFY